MMNNNNNNKNEVRKESNDDDDEAVDATGDLSPLPSIPPLPRSYCFHLWQRRTSLVRRESEGLALQPPQLRPSSSQSSESSSSEFHFPPKPMPSLARRTSEGLNTMFGKAMDSNEKKSSVILQEATTKPLPPLMRRAESQGLSTSLVAPHNHQTSFRSVQEEIEKENNDEEDLNNDHGGSSSETTTPLPPLMRRAESKGLSSFLAPTKHQNSLGSLQEEMKGENNDEDQEDQYSDKGNSSSEMITPLPPLIPQVMRRAESQGLSSSLAAPKKHQTSLGSVLEDIDEENNDKVQEDPNDNEGNSSSSSSSSFRDQKTKSTTPITPTTLIVSDYDDDDDDDDEEETEKAQDDKVRVDSGDNNLENDHKPLKKTIAATVIVVAAAVAVCIAALFFAGIISMPDNDSSQITTSDGISDPCSIPNPSIYPGKLSLFLESMPNTLDIREQRLIESILIEAYNDIAGCEEYHQRTMVNATMLSQGRQNAHGLLETTFESYVVCNGCLQSEPLFSFGDSNSDVDEERKLRRLRRSGQNDDATMTTDSDIDTTTDSVTMSNFLNIRILDSDSFETAEEFWKDFIARVNILVASLVQTEELPPATDIPYAFTRSVTDGSEVLEFNITEEEESLEEVNKAPTAASSFSPSELPSDSISPSIQPSVLPSLSFGPSLIPTQVSSPSPSRELSQAPSGSASPSIQPSVLPSLSFGGPSLIPTQVSSPSPSRELSQAPSGSASPSIDLSSSLPTISPSAFPTAEVTTTPSQIPSSIPTALDSSTPTSMSPSYSPTSSSSVSPTISPSIRASTTPSTRASNEPSLRPSISSSNPDSDGNIDSGNQDPTVLPTITPSQIPSSFPSNFPSEQPSSIPSSEPSSEPSSSPSLESSLAPSTTIPSSLPTGFPSISPSTAMPSSIQSGSPSNSAVPTTGESTRPSFSAVPSSQPTKGPTDLPSSQPSEQPSSQPSLSPDASASPTGTSSTSPTSSQSPSMNPSEVPSRLPSLVPSLRPSGSPSELPSRTPTDNPSEIPSSLPSKRPSENPSETPSETPSSSPSNSPSQPAASIPGEPSSTPSIRPTCLEPPYIELEFDNDTSDFGIGNSCGNGNALEELYQVAVDGQPIDFNGGTFDGCGSANCVVGCIDTNCDRSFDGSRCVNMEREPLAVDGNTVEMRFGGDVITDGGFDDCCGAFSAVGHYIDTTAAQLDLDSATEDLPSRLCYEYRARGGGDWYEAAIVMYEATSAGTHGLPSTSTSIVDRRVIRGSQISNFQRDCFDAPSPGFYFLAFFTSSYDRSNGGVLGGTMEVNSFVASDVDLDGICTDGLRGSDRDQT